jgi:hypothetical protein
MSTSQWVSIVAAVLAGIGAIATVLMGWATWGAEMPIILAALAVLGIHPNLPTIQ